MEGFLAQPRYRGRASVLDFVGFLLKNRWGLGWGKGERSERGGKERELGLVCKIKDCFIKKSVCKFKKTRLTTFCT